MQRIKLVLAHSGERLCFCVPLPCTVLQLSQLIAQRLSGHPIHSRLSKYIASIKLRLSDGDYELFGLDPVQFVIQPEDVVLVTFNTNAVDRLMQIKRDQIQQKSLSEPKKDVPEMKQQHVPPPAAVVTVAVAPPVNHVAPPPPSIPRTVPPQQQQLLQQQRLQQQQPVRMKPPMHLQLKAQEPMASAAAMGNGPPGLGANGGAAITRRTPTEPVAPPQQMQQQAALNLLVSIAENAPNGITLQALRVEFFKKCGADVESIIGVPLHRFAQTHSQECGLILLQTGVKEFTIQKGTDFTESLVGTIAEKIDSQGGNWITEQELLAKLAEIYPWLTYHSIPDIFRCDSLSAFITSRIIAVKYDTQLNGGSYVYESKQAKSKPAKPETKPKPKPKPEPYRAVKKAIVPPPEVEAKPPSRFPRPDDAQRPSRQAKAAPKPFTPSVSSQDSSSDEELDETRPTPPPPQSYDDGDVKKKEEEEEEESAMVNPMASLSDSTITLAAVGAAILEQLRLAPLQHTDDDIVVDGIVTKDLDTKLKQQWPHFSHEDFDFVNFKQMIEISFADRLIVLPFLSRNDGYEYMVFSRPPNTDPMASLSDEAECLVTSVVVNTMSAAAVAQQVSWNIDDGDADGTSEESTILKKIVDNDITGMKLLQMRISDWKKLDPDIDIDDIFNYTDDFFFPHVGAESTRRALEDRYARRRSNRDASQQSSLKELRPTLTIDYGLFPYNNPVLLLISKKGSAADMMDMLGMHPCLSLDVQSRKDGYTCLHWGAWRGMDQPVAELLSRGADPTKLNRHGETALDSARHAKKTKAVLVLEKWGRRTKK